MTKACTNCKRADVKFSKSRLTSDGLQYHCVDCNRYYRQKNTKKLNATKIRRLSEIKEEGIKEYGGKCTCCGETEVVFLTIDHIFNDGAEHRKTLKPNQHLTGKKFWQWLKSQGYPKDRYRLLCFNCNSGRDINGGVCPHLYKKAGINDVQYESD